MEVDKRKQQLLVLVLSVAFCVALITDCIVQPHQVCPQSLAKQAPKISVMLACCQRSAETVDVEAITCHHDTQQDASSWLKQCRWAVLGLHGKAAGEKNASNTPVSIAVDTLPTGYVMATCHGQTRQHLSNCKHDFFVPDT